MFPVEAVLYVFVLWVQVVQYSVCIVLKSRCENHDFVELGHLFQKLNYAWADQKVSSQVVFTKVDQSLFKV